MIMSDEIALKFSWCGRQEKMAGEDLLISKLISGNLSFMHI